MSPVDTRAPPRGPNARRPCADRFHVIRPFDANTFINDFVAERDREPVGGSYGFTDFVRNNIALPGLDSRRVASRHHAKILSAARASDLKGVKEALEEAGYATTPVRRAQLAAFLAAPCGRTVLMYNNTADVYVLGELGPVGNWTKLSQLRATTVAKIYGGGAGGGGGEETLQPFRKVEWTRLGRMTAVTPQGHRNEITYTQLTWSSKDAHTPLYRAFVSHSQPLPTQTSSLSLEAMAAWAKSGASSSRNARSKRRRDGEAAAAASPESAAGREHDARQTRASSRTMRSGGIDAPHPQSLGTTLAPPRRTMQLRRTTTDSAGTSANAQGRQGTASEHATQPVPSVATRRRRDGEAAVAVPSSRSEPLEDGMACLNCLSEARTTAAIPCGHKLVCDECAKDLSVNSVKKCWACRNPVTVLVRIYD